MFSQELENLIQATLEDGKLEQYEKDALIKRAQAEGVDLTELEIYINSILQKRQRELEKEKKAAYAKAEKKKKEEFGRVCPNCGRQVPPLTLKCECGYEFTNQKAVSSVELFSSKLEKTRWMDEKLGIISTFPVPNSKEDIIDFLALSISSANKKLGFTDTKKGFLTALISGTLALSLIGSLIGFFMDDKQIFFIGAVSGPLLLLVGLLDYGNKDFEEEELKNAWRAKFDQVLMKGRSLRGDAEFTRQLDYYEEQFNR